METFDDFVQKLNMDRDGKQHDTSDTKEGIQKYLPGNIMVNDFEISTWNVRAQDNSGATKDLKSILQVYDLDIMTKQEIRRSNDVFKQSTAIQIKPFKKKNTKKKYIYFILFQKLADNVIPIQIII